MHSGSGRSDCPDKRSDCPGTGSVPSAVPFCKAAGSESDWNSYPDSCSAPGSFPDSGSFPGFDFPDTSAVHMRNGLPVLCIPAEIPFSHSRFHALFPPDPDPSL